MGRLAWNWSIHAAAELFQFVKNRKGLAICQPFFCIMEESTRFSRMPTATAPTAKKVSTRKPRARKAAAKKPQVSKVTVTTFKGGKPVAKVTTLKRPSTRNLISSDRYLKDFQTRWAIHQYEIQELGRDLRKGFEFVKPYHAQAVKTVKAWTV